MRTIEVYTERNASLLLGLYMFLRSIDRVRCVLGLLRFIREGRAAPASHQCQASHREKTSFRSAYINYILGRSAFSSAFSQVCIQSQVCVQTVHASNNKLWFWVSPKAVEEVSRNGLTCWLIITAVPGGGSLSCLLSWTFRIQPAAPFLYIWDPTCSSTCPAWGKS